MKFNLLTVFHILLESIVLLQMYIIPGKFVIKVRQYQSKSAGEHVLQWTKINIE